MDNMFTIQTNNGNEVGKGLSGFWLKMIAVITMLIDHSAATIMERYMMANGLGFYGGMGFDRWQIAYLIFRGIGRMAFPIYCFLLVEGFTYTKSRSGYAVRLGIFALISEIPFDLAFQRSFFDMSYNNVFFTLFIGLLTIMMLDWIRNRPYFTDRCKSGASWFFATLLRCIAMTAVIMVMLAAAEIALHTDYGASGVAAIVLIYLLRKHPQTGFAASVILLGLWSSILEFLAILMMVPIHFYNGTRGKQMKYFFYAFYPVHLLILVGICALLGLN